MVPPGDLNTHLGMQKGAEKYMNIQGFEDTPVTFDIGLLAKASEVQWS